MKHVIFLGDGMADYPLEQLGGKTPLEAANHPHMDTMATFGQMGLAQTIPEGMPAGSDVANLSVIGADPTQCYTGRSPLEAVSLGITLGERDVTYRCNLVTLSREATLQEKTMEDYSAGEISSEEAAQLIAVMQQRFGSESVEFHPGVSYRHCLVLRDAAEGADTTPPHDISGRAIESHLPKGTNSALMLEMMAFSLTAFAEHPVNQRRRAEGKNPALCVWFWGEGRRPRLYQFPERYQARGGMISAVDLLHGIALSMGLESIPVAHITGNMHTDFKAKGLAAIQALKDGLDFVYIHVEAPDECGHQNLLEGKVWSIEQIDQHVVGPVLAYLKSCGEDWSALLMPDHPTPISTRTHARDPVPFVLLENGMTEATPRRYHENAARATGLFIPQAFCLMDRLMGIKEDGMR